MNLDIKQLLAELYQLDPQLKTQETELLKIIKLMLKEKPQVKFDDNFKNELRTRLLARAQELKNSKPAKAGLFASVRFWQVFSLTTSLAVIMILVALPFLTSGPEGTSGPSSVADFFSSKVTFENLRANAFGNLAVQPSVTDSQAPLASEANGFGGGGLKSSASAPLGLGMDNKATSEIMPYPYIVYDYKFNYAGDELPDLPETVTVMKRIKENNQQFNDVFKRVNLGLLDTSKFGNLKIQYLNLYEDKNGGYMVDINPREGIISLSINWTNWQPDAAMDSRSITLAEVENDAKTISIADKFLAEYGINKDNFGQPEVDHQWRVFYAKDNNQAEVNLPDTLNVIYPLIVNGQQVYEEYGGKVGLNVSVNLRQEKVMGLYNLMTANFQTSDYAGETDKERIKNIAVAGGLYNYQPIYDSNTQVKKVEITLGTPTFALMRYWQNDGNQSTELFVPAYVFPITETKGDLNYYKQGIVVPLAKEILDSVNTNLPSPPKIVPLMESQAEATDSVSEPGQAGSLNYETARQIALDSDCLQEGNLKDDYFYNENTKTWWFNLDIDKPGCNPACVVSEETKTAEINWRCTGLIPE